MKCIGRAVCLILCAAVLLTLGGCETRKLNERLLIHGIGVDINGDGYTVTVRSSASGDKGEEYFKCEGDSVLEALTSLTLSTGREPLYSHNYVTVFGRSCAENGLEESMDFFVRYYNTRPSVQMYLAENTAEEILSLRSEGEYMKMTELRDLSGFGEYNGLVCRTEILDFINGAQKEGSSSVAPVIGIREGKAEIVSTAYFEDYRLKSFLSLDETRGFLAVTQELKKGELTVEDEELGKVSLSLTDAKRELSAQTENGRVVFFLNIEVKADVSSASPGRSGFGEEVYSRLAEKAAQSIKSCAASAVHRAVTENSCDIFGFGNFLYTRYPAYWKKAGGTWREDMSLCEYRINVTARILRPEQEMLG